MCPSKAINKSNFPQFSTMSTVLRTLLFCKIHTLKTLPLNVHEGSTFFHEAPFLTATRKSPSKQPRQPLCRTLEVADPIQNTSLAQMLHRKQGVCPAPGTRHRDSFPIRNPWKAQNLQSSNDWFFGRVLLSLQRQAKMTFSGDRAWREAVWTQVFYCSSYSAQKHVSVQDVGTLWCIGASWHLSAYHSHIVKLLRKYNSSLFS